MSIAPLGVFLLVAHDITRRGVRSWLESAPGIEVVGESGSATGVIPAILRSRPAVAVLDAQLPDGSAAEVCRVVRSANPRIRTLMLTSEANDEAMHAAILAGADGYVLKKIKGRSLISGIRLVASGHLFMDSAATMGLLRQSLRRIPEELTALSDSEHQVLDAIADGLSNREIAARLHLAEQTVKNQITTVMAKLGVQRRTQAALLAARLRRMAG